MEHSSKLFYGVLAVLALTALGWGTAHAGAEGLAFGLFTVMTLGGALICIWERSVVRSAFALMATFSGISGYFVLLESDFLAMAQLLIYVGAILALLLFGVMLSAPDLSERQLPRVLGSLAAIGLATAWVSSKVAATLELGAMPELVEGPLGNAKLIGQGFLRADQYVVAFELAAVLLTVALVAAVYIARRKKRDLTPPSGPGQALLGSTTGSEARH